MFMLVFNNINSQPIPPGHGSSQNQKPAGGGAPIDNEVVILILFSSMYAYLKHNKFYLNNKNITSVRLRKK